MVWNVPRALSHVIEPSLDGAQTRQKGPADLSYWNPVLLLPTYASAA